MPFAVTVADPCYELLFLFTNKGNTFACRFAAVVFAVADCLAADVVVTAAAVAGHVIGCAQLRSIQPIASLLSAAG